MKRRIVTLSDLHIGAPYSDPFRDWDAIDAELQKATDIVLNGDIFDFMHFGQWKWGFWKDETYLNDRVTRLLDRAEFFIEAMLETYPQARIHYVLGNHDQLDALYQRMEHMAERYPGRFTVTKKHLVIGDIRFTHGDREIHHNGTERTLDTVTVKSDDGEKIDRIGQVVGCGAAVFSPMLMPIKKTIAALVKSLDAEAQAEEQPIRHVCFGHIHTPYTITNYPAGDLHIHITGYAGCGAPHTIQCFEQDETGYTTHTEAKRLGPQSLLSANLATLVKHWPQSAWRAIAGYGV
jgi:UDP-2,3-diacylglucosamine pyrophosphatase LpxH